jgi:hypothetical protein
MANQTFEEQNEFSTILSSQNPNPSQFLNFENAVDPLFGQLLNEEMIFEITNGQHIKIEKFLIILAQKLEVITMEE